MGRTPGHSRQRMLDSAVELLRERGASGVSIDAVLAHSGAPRGSVYHHFPGGRNELIITAVRQAGSYISALIDLAVAGGDPHAALKQFVEFWKQSLADGDYKAGCPVVALAVGTRDDLPEATEVASEIFTCWQDKMCDLLMANGIEPDRAHRLTTLALAAIEGAILLSRTQRSAEPLDEVVAELAPLFR